MLGFDLRRTKLKMGVQVLLNNPEDLNKIQEREVDVTMERIQAILKAGANVILTTKGIDDAAMKYFINAHAIACRRVEGRDIKRLAKATGATPQVTMADLSGEESFDPSMLGYAEEVYEERIRDDTVLVVKAPKVQQLNTVMLRGPNEMMCDEMKRSFVDATSVVKRMLDSNMLVPGGGACEAALSIYLENFATMLGSREQLAIAEFAEALLVIPKTLAVNAAKDATDLGTQQTHKQAYTCSSVPRKESLKLSPHPRHHCVLKHPSAPPSIASSYFLPFFHPPYSFPPDDSATQSPNSVPYTTSHRPIQQRPHFPNADSISKRERSETASKLA